MWTYIEHPKGVFTHQPLSMWLAQWLNENNINSKPLILHFDGKNLEAIVWVEYSQKPPVNRIGDE